MGGLNFYSEEYQKQIKLIINKFNETKMEDKLEEQPQKMDIRKEDTTNSDTGFSYTATAKTAKQYPLSRPLDDESFEKQVEMEAKNNFAYYDNLYTGKGTIDQLKNGEPVSANAFVNEAKSDSIYPQMDQNGLNSLYNQIEPLRYINVNDIPKPKALSMDDIDKLSEKLYGSKKKSSTGTIKTNTGDTILTLTTKNGKEILRFEDSGDIYIRGEFVTNDFQIIEGFREYLKSYRLHP